MTSSNPPRPIAAHRGRDALGRGGLSTAAHRCLPDGVRWRAEVVGRSPEPDETPNDDDTSGRGQSPANEKPEAGEAPPAAHDPATHLEVAATTPLLDLNTPALDAALAAMVLAIHDYDQAAWRAHALCRQYPELAWHEALEKLKLRRRELEELRSICARCPVRQPCDDWSSGLKAMPGVVAGRTRGERFALRRTSTSTPPTTEPTTTATEPATKD